MTLRNAFGEVATEVTLAALLLELGQKLEPGGAVQDSYLFGEVLPDQAASIAEVKTFNFTGAKLHDLIWVHVVGGLGRADPFGGIPAAALGIRCPDDIPIPMTIGAALVRVYVPAGASCTVYGYRYIA